MFYCSLHFLHSHYPKVWCYIVYLAVVNTCRTQMYMVSLAVLENWIKIQELILASPNTLSAPLLLNRERLTFFKLPITRNST